MPSFFTTLPNDLKLKIFAAVSKHEQAQLTQVNQEFHNLITKANDLELTQFRSEHAAYEHSTCRVGHVLVVLEEYEYPYASCIWLAYENSKPYSPLSIAAEDSEKIRLSMKKGESDLLQALREIELKTVAEEIEKINSEFLNTKQTTPTPSIT